MCYNFVITPLCQRWCSDVCSGCYREPFGKYYNATW